MPQIPILRCSCGAPAGKRCSFRLSPELICLGGIPGIQVCRALLCERCDCPRHDASTQEVD